MTMVMMEERPTQERPVVMAGMTEDEFLNLPDDGFRYEYVNGEALGMAASVWHAAIGAWIVGQLGPFVDEFGILVNSQAGYRMTNGNVRCPDVSFFRFDSMPNGEPPRTVADRTPDLCIEIISPSETYGDDYDKMVEYLESGAEQIWLLEPLLRRRTVHNAPN